MLSNEDFEAELDAAHTDYEEKDISREVNELVQYVQRELVASAKIGRDTVRFYLHNTTQRVRHGFIKWLMSLHIEFGADEKFSHFNSFVKVPDDVYVRVPKYGKLKYERELRERWAREAAERDAQLLAEAAANAED